MSDEPKTFWMIELNDGSGWLSSLRGKTSSDAVQSLRFDTIEQANHARNGLPASLWSQFKPAPTEHKWCAEDSLRPNVTPVLPAALAAARTAGPWIASNAHHGPTFWRVETDAPGYPNDGYVIADFHGPDAEANSKLAASALSLLEALEECAAVIFDRIPRFPHDGPRSEEEHAEYVALGSAHALARAAISSARGAGK